MSAQDTVIFFVAKAAVVAQVGGDHIAAHPLTAGGTVIFLVAEGAVVAEMGWYSCASHPFATGNAVVLLVAEAAVVAEVSPCPRHTLLRKNYIKWMDMIGINEITKAHSCRMKQNCLSGCPIRNCCINGLEPYSLPSSFR